MIYLVSVDGHDGDSVVARRFGTHGYFDADYAYYEPRVSNPGNYERHLFAAGTTTGQSSVGVGEIVLRNEDGGLDHLDRWGFAGRAVTIGRTRGGTEVETVWRGTVEQPVPSWSELQFRVRDRLEELRRPIQANTFSGVTVSGGRSDAEGRPDDLMDRPKPLVFGRVLNVTPAAANVYDLVWQVNDGPVADIPAVYDKAVALRRGADYPTLAALIAAPTAPGTYDTCLAAGYFKLGSSPVGQVTADVTEGVTPAARTAARVVARMLARGGLPADQLDAGSVAALDAKTTAEVGIYIADERHTLDAVTEVLESVGGYLVPDRQGAFRLGRLEAPGAPVATIDLADAREITPFVSGDQGRGIPAWRVVVKYARNWTPMGRSELVEGPCASQERRAWLAAETRDAKAEDPAVKAVHPLAPEIPFSSLLLDAGAAQAEAARRLALYGTGRSFLRVPVPPEVAAERELGETVVLEAPRFGCADGKPVVVMGIVEDYGAAAGQLILWG